MVIPTSYPPLRGLPNADARAELRRHFGEFEDSDYGQGWAKLWEAGDLLPWDRGRPSPALIDTLENYREVIGGAVFDGKRKKALVPGCGRGVDVLLLASYGYDAVGLEISPEAVNACHEFAQANESSYPVRDEKVGKGSRQYVLGDFYNNEWKMEVGLDADEPFDLIYDYTFFCAMRPRMRPAWAKRMSDLLKDSPLANLVCLEFPTDKPASTGGPPFGSPSSAYIEHLAHPGVQVPYDDQGNVKFNAYPEYSEGGLERVEYHHPQDTHAAGKDDAGNVKDYISIWRHR